MDSIIKSFVSIGLVYTTHYASIKVYDTFCVPDGIWGFITGLLTTGSPACNVALKVAENTGASYTAVLTVGLTRFILDLITYTPVLPKPPSPRSVSESESTQ
jgi:hypothetical protein